MLTSREIRRQFIDFFVQRHGHAFVPSSPVVPHNDPTLLFTNAGMNQFKPYFLGAEAAPWKRVANTQKCIRAGGKHNDLDDVGRSRRHHTFFEMLGNWSFGDYFKRGAIEMAWELLTRTYGLDPSRLHVTCYEGDPANGVPRDTEAAEIWRDVIGVPVDHIHFFGKDNFWEMGDTGPCGPCTEIHIDRTPDGSGGSLVNGDDPRVMEIWNLVFIQFNRNADRSLTPLPSQHVDTGMGFERIVQVVQGKDDNYATELWSPLFDAIAKLSGLRYTGLFPPTNAPDPVAEAANPQLRTDIAFRVIADHARCLTFALTDGALPSNEGRGYVLRRVLRRAVRFGRQQLGLGQPFLHRLVPVVAESMGDAFPELGREPARVAEVIRDEEESFGRTLDRGIALFNEAAERADGTVIAAEDAFRLHDTFGFPIDLTQVMAAERGMSVDTEGFSTLMERAREQARGAGASADARGSLVTALQRDALPPTAFIGYDRTESRVKASVQLYALKGEEYHRAQRAGVGARVAMAVDQTPFYPEMGGQVGDTGTIENEACGVLRVSDTIKVGDVTFHLGEVEAGEFTAAAADAGREESLVLRVDAARRAKIAANHTVTHVMNHKLRAVLGDHVQQKGSLVDESKTRFDFSHGGALRPEELESVEEGVGRDIAADLPVYAEVAPQEDALKINSLRAVFGEKYPPRVRVVSIGVPLTDLLGNPANQAWRDYSIEFCGGTHLATTGGAERFVITSEEAVSKGVRRLTALTGRAALDAAARGTAMLQRLEVLRGLGAADVAAPLAELSAELVAHGAGLPATARAKLRDGIAELQKGVKELDRQRSKVAAGDVVETARRIAESADGGPVIVTSIEGADADALRTAMDVIRKKKPDAALLLGGVAGDKVSFVAAVPELLVKKGLKAGDWVREVAKAAGGGGGGRPDMAQAGGKDPSKLDEALEVGRKFASQKTG